MHIHTIRLRESGHSQACRLFAHYEVAIALFDHGKEPHHGYFESRTLSPMVHWIVSFSEVRRVTFRVPYTGCNAHDTFDTADVASDNGFRLGDKMRIEGENGAGRFSRGLAGGLHLELIAPT